MRNFARKKFFAEVRAAGIKSRPKKSLTSFLRKQGPSAMRPKVRPRHLRKGQAADAVVCFVRLAAASSDVFVCVAAAKATSRWCVIGLLVIWALGPCVRRGDG